MTPILRAACTAAMLFAAALALNASSAAAAPVKADFFVAQDGNDAWSGTLAVPNRTKTNGPFATLDRARQAVRALKEKRAAPITVLVRGGTYEMRGPLVFTPEDSGTAQAPISYAAFPGERPVFSAGTRITGWKQSAPGRWEVTLPEVRDGKWRFSQLYVNGERRYRPRLPKQGYYYIAGEVPATPENLGQGFDRFRFKAGEIRADWHNREDVEILPFHTWTMSRFPIADVDEKERIVTFAGRTIGKETFTSLAKGNRYLVENVREALSGPGEWYLDTKTGVLTYLAKPGEDPNRAVVTAPRIERLVEFRGDLDREVIDHIISYSAEQRYESPVKLKGAYARHIVLRGLTFAHTAWNVPEKGHTFWQAEVIIPAAIDMVGAWEVRMENCVVRNLGNWAVKIGKGSKYVSIRDCELIDLGAGGVMIGETSNFEEERLLASHNVIRDCLIAHGGRIHNAAIGVWIGHSPYNVIEHNEIVDFYYTGISPGWSWGYGLSGAHHNRIAYNHIRNIGQGVLSDMGGIYTLGVSPGTVLDHNLIHDVDSFSYGGWGIYFDEGTTDTVATNNIAYNTKSAPFHQHYGKNNVVKNNILAFGREAQLIRTRPEEHRSFTLTNNIIYWKEGPLLGSNWSGDNYALDSNLYWNAAGQPVRFANLTFEEWQKKGQDRNSLIADPLFVAPDKGDFRLRPGSPAAKIGFTPIDIRKVGRLSAKPYTKTVPRAFPPPPPPAPPQPIAEDFDERAPGAKPGGALIVHEEPAVPAANIRVTDETAASGKHSLKVTDAAGQQQRYNPHLYYRPKFDKGTIVGRFALRLEPGAVFYHEWRDAASPYRVGPTLRIDANGRLLASGRPIATLPHSRWITFEIVCVVGEKAAGTYDLTVRLGGRVPPIRQTGLPCGSGAAFSSLQWFGFVSDADGPGVFYLDDISVTPR